MKKKNAGFSLIEVTIALAIFTTSVLVLTQGMLNCITCMQSLIPEKLDNESISFVRTHILKQTDKDEVEEGGKIQTVFNGKAAWDAEVIEAEILDLFKVAIRMEFEKPLANKKKEHKETVYVLRPSWSDPVKRSQLVEDRKQHLDQMRTDQRRSS